MKKLNDDDLFARWSLFFTNSFKLLFCLNKLWLLLATLFNRLIVEKFNNSDGLFEVELDDNVVDRDEFVRVR